MAGEGVDAEALAAAELAIVRGELAEAVRRQSPGEEPPEVQEAAALADRSVDDLVLVARIGAGSFTEVWRAWDRSLGRWVAVKRPLTPPERREDLERLAREAHAVSLLPRR